jgi:epoxyqueuosine reductase
MCGTCNRCRAACPTDAFPAPYVLDARRCISYLTIEHKGWIDPALRPLMGNWVMGCDICQEVCPFSRFARPTGESAFLPVSPDRAAPPLLDLLRLDENSFQARFEGSPVLRLKRDRLVRNACVAAGNWGSASAVPALNDLLRDPSALVRGHAAWALGRILGTSALPALEAALHAETDPEAASDIKRTLDRVSPKGAL